MDVEASGHRTLFGAEGVALTGRQFSISSQQAVFEDEADRTVLGQCQSVLTFLTYVHAEFHHGIAQRPFVDGIAGLSAHAEELRHQRVEAHKLTGIAVQLIAGLSLFVYYHAGVVGTVLTRQQQVVHRALCRIGCGHLYRCFREQSGVHVGLSALLGKGDGFLIHGALHEERLSRTEDVAVVHGAVGYIALVIGVPHGDGSLEVEEARIEERRIGVTDEVPRTVVLKLAEVLFEGHFAVGGEEDGLSVHTLRKGLHVEISAATREVEGITLAGLQHTVAAHVNPGGIHLAIRAVLARVLAYDPLGVAVHLYKVLHLDIEGYAEEVPAVFVEGIHQVYVLGAHLAVHDETSGVILRIIIIGRTIQAIRFGFIRIIFGIRRHVHPELVGRQFAAAVDGEVTAFIIVLSVTVLSACIGPFQVDIRAIVGGKRVAEGKSKVLVDDHILGHIVRSLHRNKLSPAIGQLIFLQAPGGHIEYRAVEIVA